MAPKKSVLILITALILMTFVTTGCERSYAESEESQATPTLDAGSEFPVTLPADMEGVFASGAQTSTAIAVASGAPSVDAATLVSTLDPAEATETPIPPADATAVDTVPPTATNTALPPTESGTKPSTYTLKQGEFPYCIARRFNVSPSELLNLNGLTTAQAQVYNPGLTLQIPQGGAAFPSPRYLNDHPTSYTTPKIMTVYGVACYFGDVDPVAITNANTIPDLYNIPAGTTLSIP